MKFDCIHDIENWQGIISAAFEHDIAEIEAKIVDIQTDYEEIKDSNKNKAAELKRYLSKFNKLRQLFYRLELSEVERNLLSNKILVVEGKAGIGKTQLFANEAISLLNSNENALLIIGSDCLSDINIFEQLKNNLRLDFDFENLIDILEVIGEKNGKIVPILIDALNESWKPQLWKSVLPILYNKVNDKNYVRLAISFRSEYQNSILPERFLELDNVVKIEHRGFRSNSLEAAKKFLGHYGITFTPLHMFNTNIDNAPYFSQVNEHIKDAIQENDCINEENVFNEKKWLNETSIFFEKQKEDLLLTDDSGTQWIVLSKYADTGRNDLAYDKLKVWNWLYGYFVNDEQLAILKKYADKKVNMLSGEIYSGSVVKTKILDFCLDN